MGDVIKPQFYIGAFEKLSILQQSEGETVFSNHQLRRRDERLKRITCFGREFSGLCQPADLNEITSNQKDNRKSTSAKRSFHCPSPRQQAHNNNTNLRLGFYRAVCCLCGLSTTQTYGAGI